MDNIYYNPEKFGLKVVGEVNCDEDYSFERTVVFQDKDGTIYYLQDSGCSCPTPFDDYDKEDLVKIESVVQFEEAVISYHGEYMNEREKVWIKKDARNLIKDLI